MPKLSPYPPDNIWLFTAHNRRRRHHAFTDAVPHPNARNRGELSSLPARRFVRYFLDPAEACAHFLIQDPMDLKVCTTPIGKRELIALSLVFHEFFSDGDRYKPRDPDQMVRDEQSYILMPMAFDKRGNSKKDFGAPLKFQYLSSIIGDIEHTPRLRHRYAPLLDLLQKTGVYTFTRRGRRRDGSVADIA
jgi:hypothetical protein